MSSALYITGETERQGRLLLAAHDRLLTCASNPITPSVFSLPAQGTSTGTVQAGWDLELRRFPKKAKGVPPRKRPLPG